MICWHKDVLDVLAKIRQKVKDTGRWPVNFMIFSWPQNIGKKYITRDFINRFDLYEQDKLWIEDPGENDKKLYQLKVDVDRKERIIEVAGKKYNNYGSRQIVDYVSRSPVWGKKVIFIENIDRMTWSSANAMLKTFEEPPDNVMLIATVSNEQKILKTILSRALIIRFNIPVLNEIIDCLQQEFPEKTVEELEMAYNFTWWRIGFMMRILKEESAFLDIFNNFVQVKQVVWDYAKKWNMIKSILWVWDINLFLDSLIFYYTHNRYYKYATELIDIKKKILANVSVDNLIFNFLIR